MTLKFRRSNNLHDGYHEVDLANGGRFEGEIRDGEPNGPGMMLFPDGTIYIGEFRAGIFHGLGIKYLPEGNRAGVERFEGEFRDGRFQTGIQWTFGDPIHFEDGTYVSDWTSAELTNLSENLGSPPPDIDESERQKRLENAKERAMSATKYALQSTEIA